MRRPFGSRGKGIEGANLGAAFAMDAGTMTPLLKRLEVSGMVEPATSEERHVLIALTGMCIEKGGLASLTSGSGVMLCSVSL